LTFCKRNSAKIILLIIFYVFLILLLFFLSNSNFIKERYMNNQQTNFKNVFETFEIHF